MLDSIEVFVLQNSVRKKKHPKTEKNNNKQQDFNPRSALFANQNDFYAHTKTALFANQTIESRDSNVTGQRDFMVIFQFSFDLMLHTHYRPFGSHSGRLLEDVLGAGVSHNRHAHRSMFVSRWDLN